MRSLWILLPLILTGCTTPPPPAPTPLTQVVPVASPTKLVETGYAVRSYRDSANPAIWHEAHVVYRRTRVPVTASDDYSTVPRTSAPPISFAPLSSSDELAAELATQKKITADLHAMQVSVTETEQRLEAQYATLVRQSADVLKVHEQLAAERNRTQAAAPVAATATALTDKTGGKTTADW